MNLTSLEQEKNLLVLDVYVTREDCAGFACWCVDPMFADQFILKLVQTGLEAELASCFALQDF